MNNDTIHKMVQSLTRMLYEKLPNSQYGSYCSLYSDALRNNLITREEFAIAKEYYGHIWNYAGD